MIATLATATPTLSHHAYAFIADKVYEPSRIRLGDDQQALVSGRRAKRLRHLPLDSYDASCAYRESTRGTEEIGQLVDCISTNHTHFFREIEQPNFLRDVTLPEWVPRLTRERANARPSSFGARRVPPVRSHTPWPSSWQSMPASMAPCTGRSRVRTSPPASWTTPRSSAA